MPSPLTDDEKARVRHHTGYPEVLPAASIQYGLPKPAQLAFMIELAMDNLMPSAAQRVRDILNVLDSLEQQMINAQCQLGVDKVEEITMAGAMDDKARLVTDRLEAEYLRWARRLADIFGCPLYPFSERFAKNRGGSVSNIRVVS